METNFKNSLDPTLTIDSDRNKFWKYKELFHNMNGPAIEWADGKKEWYLFNMRHRTDGPAIEYPNGHKSWWFNSRLHRLDGPARIWPNGDKEWWIKGCQLTELEFFMKTGLGN